SDLFRQLESQRDRLTRAIVAGEWLVDFDFVVCPRCGNDVDDTRAESHVCYLCLQPTSKDDSVDALLSEQSRITDQIDETASVIKAREATKQAALADLARLDDRLADWNGQLNAATDAFVS